MNAAQLHLALTHVPVILCLAGLVMLFVALLRKNRGLTLTAYWVLLAAGIFALPVYLSGEGAEEIVENLAGVVTTAVEPHEELAELGLILVLLAAAASLLGLLFAGREKSFAAIRVVVLLLALAATAVLVQTAHLGGAIRHPEISGTQAAPPNGSGEKDEEESTRH